MKRLLIGLLKLLLKLVIFALTGAWPRFGDDAEPASPAQQKKPKKQRQKSPRPPRPSRRPRLFQPGPPSGGYAFGDEGLSLEETLGAPRFGEGGAPTAVRRARGGRALAPQGPKRERPTLGSVLRTPSELRDALVLGEALAPRRPRR